MNTWEKFYLVSKEEGAFVMDLGVLLFEMGYFEEALDFFKRAQEIQGENEILKKNIAACQNRIFPKG